MQSTRFDFTMPYVDERTGSTFHDTKSIGEAAAESRDLLGLGTSASCDATESCVELVAMLRRLSWMSLLLVGACSDSNPGPLVDAGTAPPALVPPAPPDEGDLDDPGFVRAPEPAVVTATAAAAPAPGPCPMGWQTVALGAGRRCEAPATRTDCAAGEQATLEGECRVFGVACPADGWPVGLPNDAPILYVDPEAAPGGDGSLAQPFEHLPVAVARAPEGAILALRTGTHVGPVALDRPVTLWGACASGTTVTADASEGESVVRVVGPDVVVRDLRVTGPRIGITAGRQGSSTPARLRLERVELADLVGLGLAAFEGTSVEAVDLWSHDIRPRPTTDLGGHNIFVSGGNASVAEAVLERGARVAARVEGGGRLGLERVVIREIATDADRLGAGLAAVEASRLELRGVLVEDVAQFGVYALSESVVDAEHFEVRAVRPMLEQGVELGCAVYLVGGAEADLRAASFHGLHLHAILAYDEQTLVRLSDAWIGEITRQLARYTVAITTGSRIEVERLWIDDWAGINVRDPGSSGAVRDLTMRWDGAAGVRPLSGLLAASGAHSVTATAVDVVGAAGVTVLDPDSRMRVSGLWVRQNRRVSFAANAVEGGALELENARLEGAEEVALGVSEGGTLDAKDVVVVDPGYGVGALSASGVSLARVRIEAPREVGLWLAGGTSGVRDLEVVDHPPGAGATVAVHATEGAQVELQRARLHGLAGDGVRVMERSHLAAADVSLQGDGQDGSSIGLYVHAEGGAEVERLFVDGYVAGVYANGPTVASDVSVRGPDSPLDGVGFGGSGALELRRGRLTRVRGVALWARGPGGLLAEDVVVDQVERTSGGLGFGAAATDGARLELLRGRLSGTGFAGVYASEDSVVQARDLVVQDSLRSPCSECTYESVAAGVFAQDSAMIDLERFELLRMETAGVYVFGGGQVDAREGIIGECGIGLLVDDSDFDIARISERVWFRGNGRSQQSEASGLPPIRLEPPAPPPDPMGPGG